MSHHLHVTVVTAQGTAGNNRGDNEGNKSQLQKVYRNGDPYTTVSSEAIRYALREGLHSHAERDRVGEERLELTGRISTLRAEIEELRSPASDDQKKKRASKKKPSAADSQPQDKDAQQKKLKEKEEQLKQLEDSLAKLQPEGGPKLRLNRWMPDHKSNRWHDPKFTNWRDFFDDDVLGFMNAKEETDSHRGILEVTRAISTTPWRGEVVVNYASPRSNPGVGHENPIPYTIEVHHTRYQYSFTMTPEALAADRYERTAWALQGLLNIRRVGGNHAHFLFDFAPEAIVLRWTHDPAPRILCCFEEDEYGAVGLAKLRTRVERKDIASDELWVGSVIDLKDCPELPLGRYILPDPPAPGVIDPKDRPKLPSEREREKLGPKAAVQSVLSSIKESLSQVATGA